MKYAIIIADGASDEPLDELDGATPLEIAHTPNLDAIARAGKVGRCVTTPPGFQTGSDTCSMCLLGYDPAEHHTGRAPLEAAALGVSAEPDDFIFRLNFVTVSDDEPPHSLMLDHSAGGIPGREAATLLRDLHEHWLRHEPAIAKDLAVTPGVGYRNILVDACGLDFRGVETVPPHQIPDEPWANHLPDGGEPGAAERMNRLIELSHRFLPSHPINEARLAQGLRPANMAWIWGQGTPTALPSFYERFGLRGAITTAVDLLAGIALAMGWDLLDVPGVSSYHDNDYAAQGRATIEALDRYDIVCCHVESPDEAAHQGDSETKIKAIEAIDAEIIGPVVSRLRDFGDPERVPGEGGWRIMILPDHATLCRTRKHGPNPVPLAIGGSWVRSVVQRVMTEAAAAESDLFVDPGHELMEYFLFSGLKERPGVMTGDRS